LPAESEAEARCSVVQRNLPPEITSLIDGLAGCLADAPGATAVVDLLRAHYRPGRPLAEAFAGALAAIFGDEGLLFLNPRDPRLAALAAPIYRRSIEDAAAIDAALAAQGARLESAGFAEQIPPRPGSTLVFFHRDDARGPRYRLQRAGEDVWELTGCEHKVTHREVLALTERDPLRFSTSALLRPLVQDTLLPTVAYVGGPAEVSYFAQLMPLYPLFGVTPPLVMPRARFRCVDARARRRLAALKLSADDLHLPTDELLARIAVQRPPDAADPATLKAIVDDEVAPRVAALTSAIERAFPHLARAAERTNDSVSHVLRKLTNRYARALLERDTATQQRLRWLQDTLVPGGVPQERVFGWPWLAAQLGPDVLKRLVFEELTKRGTFVTELIEICP
jgi:bacillithiol biosynthesis cysteine-adding enzyme BshC